MQKIFSKLESWVFYLLIFAVPFETRLIVARWTRPFNEWTAGFVYGTDILIFLLFIFWLVRVLKTKSSGGIKSELAETFKPKWSNPHLWLAGFFIVSALSIFNSRIVGLSLYQLLKLAEFIGFYFYLVRSQTPSASADAPMAHRTSNGVYLRSAFGKVCEFRRILAVIIASGIFQAAIAIAQYLKQGSLGLKLFGESPLSVNATGVAVFIADSEKYLRAYGTTPHPNVLAAWLFLAIFAFYFLYVYREQLYVYGEQKKREHQKTEFPFYHDRDKMGTRFWLHEIGWLTIYTVLLWGLFFTFSRIIIGLWALGAIIMVLLLFKRSFRGFLTATKQYAVTIAVITLVTSSLFAAFFWPQVKSRVLVSMDEEAVTQRIFYNKIAESITIANPILGVGIGQSVPQLMSKLKHWPSYIYQPVHNIYLLIASETGLVGLSLFLLFLFFVFYGFIKRVKMRKAYQYSFSILVFSFLAMGFFDHFLWTLQQGSLIFWMTLALISLNPDLG